MKVVERQASAFTAERDELLLRAQDGGVEVALRGREAARDGIRARWGGDTVNFRQLRLRGE